jgi:hypothetical protein
MKNRIKKIASIFFLALTLMPLISSSFLIIRLKIVQHEAKEKLEKGMLQTLVLNKNEFNWFKINKEISIDGKLFDVKSFSEKNGWYVFKGIYDHDETALNKNINNSINEKANQFLTGLFQMLFSAHSSNFPELPPIGKMVVSSFPLIVQDISSPVKDILTPPPQLVFL